MAEVIGDAVRTPMSMIDIIFSPANFLIKPTVWYRAMFVDPDHKRYPDNVWYRDHDERNFDLVNLGSSGGKWAFDYEGTGIKAMNWANQPQTLLDDLCLFKNFHSILRKGGKVLIVIMPFTGLNKKTGVMDTLKYLPTLYWDIAQTMPYFHEASRLYHYPILFGKPAIKAAIKHLLGRETAPRPPRGSDTDRNQMSSEELERDAENWMRGWARQFGIDDFEAPLTPENQEGRKIRIKVMRELVDFIVEREYRPFFVIPPVERHLAEKFSKRFKDIYIYGYLKDVARDVPLLDYTNDPEWQSADLYFNSFFLNKKGRRLFTKCVWDDVQKINEM